MKKCNRCGKIKDFSQFSPNENSPDKFKSVCKKCGNKTSKKYREANPEKTREIIKLWGKKNPEKRRGYVRKYRANNIEKIREAKRQLRKNPEGRKKLNETTNRWRLKFPEREKNNHLKSQYGIGLPAYKEILKKQRNRCAICKTHMKELPTMLCVDHCHKSNKVRGLLCAGCNHLLGKAKDSIKILNSAKRYLKKYDKV